MLNASIDAAVDDFAGRVAGNCRKRVFALKHGTAGIGTLAATHGHAQLLLELGQRTRTPVAGFHHIGLGNGIA